MIFICVGSIGGAFGLSLSRLILRNKVHYRHMFSEQGMPKLLFVNSSEETIQHVVKLPWKGKRPVILVANDPIVFSGNAEEAWPACKPHSDDLSSFPAYSWQGKYVISPKVLKEAASHWIQTVASLSDQSDGVLFASSMQDGAVGLIPGLINAIRAIPRFSYPAYLGAALLFDPLPGKQGAENASAFVKHVRRACDVVAVTDRDAVDGIDGWVHALMLVLTLELQDSRIPSLSKLVNDCPESLYKGEGVVPVKGPAGRLLQSTLRTIAG
ncbi:hypothetical protein J8273_0481 [Carpediemonas membranifera]|uniref:Uncharacterized protein n=1 Tax=Carpediemonas membranifera TaxID=201153 RepID=A0A8J6E0K9_9EUKA|nr:hypothetical protein J8273_0481 [Carpediemonas membranifera]|eukprot:KAG9395259.1 hypothetical protein J8273_0481 [Carpediemonas membranifera]